MYNEEKQSSKKKQNTGSKTSSSLGCSPPEPPFLLQFLCLGLCLAARAPTENANPRRGQRMQIPGEVRNDTRGLRGHPAKQDLVRKQESLWKRKTVAV